MDAVPAAVAGEARGAQSFWAAYIDALPTSYSKPLLKLPQVKVV